MANPIELMAALGRKYRRVREDHEREGPRGTTRRRLEQEMEKIARRFEQLLTHWVRDEELREAWREFLYRGAEQPDEPALATPPLFRGETETGETVEIRETSIGGHDVLLDGVHLEQHEVPWQPYADRFAPILVGERACHETFAAPRAALEALDDFLGQAGTKPPWEWARELYDEGLIDADFGLTPRGERRTKGEPRSAVRRTSGEAPVWHTNYCVVVGNAGRARVFTLESEALEGEPVFEPLKEVADMTSSRARARDDQQFSDSRPGLRREGPHGPRHAVSDRRQDNRDDAERAFVQQIADAAAQVLSQFDACRIVLVASPPMLALLRPAIAGHLKARSRKSHFVVYEHPADLSWQGAAAVHDALASAGLVPTRGRQPPLRPMRTPNPWQG